MKQEKIHSYDEPGADFDGFQEKPLSDVVDPVLGKTPKRKEDQYWGGNIKWASAKDISQNKTRKIYETDEMMTEAGLDASNAKIMPEGTLVVVARGATMGRSAQLGNEMTFNQTCYGLKANEDLDDTFLYYAWNYKFDQIQAISHGTVFDTITMDSFNDIHIPFPELSIQRKIGHVLGSIDDQIEINNRIIGLMEEAGRAIFRSRFVDFDHYDGELLFSDELDYGIPPEWKIKPLDGIAEFLNGKAWQDHTGDEDNDLPVVKIKELRNGITEDSDRVSREKIDEEYRIGDGDVIFSWSGSLVLKVWGEGEAFLNQHLFKVTSEDYPKWFYYFWIDYHINRFRQIAEAKKTTMGHIKRSDLKQAKVLVPDSNTLKDISAFLDPLIEGIVEAQIENRRLKSLRETLLPKLMSGEIRVNSLNMGDVTKASEH